MQFNQRILSVESEHIQDIPPEILIPNSILRLLDSVGEGNYTTTYSVTISQQLEDEITKYLDLFCVHFCNQFLSYNCYACYCFR